MVFIPKDKKSNGIILEFKNADTPRLLKSRAKEALNQIRDKKYFQEFKKHKVSTALAIGLAFCGRQVELAHEKIDLKK